MGCCRLYCVFNTEGWCFLFNCVVFDLILFFAVFQYPVKCHSVTLCSYVLLYTENSGLIQCLISVMCMLCSHAKCI